MSLYTFYRRRVRTRLPALWQRGVSRAGIRLIRAYYSMRLRPAATCLLGPLFRRSRDMIEIDITYLCNLHCCNCDRSCAQLPSRERMSVGQIRRFLDDSRAAGVHWKKICVLGGEPTLHPEFLEIVGMLLEYRRDESPRTVIQVTTNGHGFKVNSILRRLPLQVNVNNTARTGDVQDDFDSFNVAPVDTRRYAGADFRNGCRVLETCGIGLTPFGYYPCAVAGSIDRVFGFDLGRKSIPQPEDEMRDVLSRFCRVCGHFKLADNPGRLTQTVMSPTWADAYKRAREKTPSLTRFPGAVLPDAGEQAERLAGWRIDRAREGALADCCLVVPTLRRIDKLLALLDCLAGRPDQPAEVAVIDGAPEEELGEYLKTWRAGHEPAFDLIYSHGPRGLTRQRNAGVDLTTRPYVFFLDDDALPSPGYFEAIHAVFASDEAGTLGGVCGYVLPEPGGGMPRRWALRFRLGIVPRVEPLRFADCGTSVPGVLMRPFTGCRPVDIMPGCAFACRREVFARDRFSCFFDGYSLGEDVEMSLRLGASWRLLCCGDAQVRHDKAPNGRPPGYARGLMDVRNRYFLWKRHRPRAGFLDRLRFWTDIALVAGLDLARAFHGPGRRHALAHAAGLTAGAVRCWLRPPLHLEKAAVRQYVLAPSQAPDEGQRVSLCD